MIQGRKIEDGSPYLTDESKLSGHADYIYMPEDENDVIDILAYANNRKTPITISAMRTGVCGGAVPQGGDILSMEKFDRIRGIGKDDRGYYIRLQPNVTVNALNDIIRRKTYVNLTELTTGAISSMRGESTEFFYPVDPTELNGSIGGNISTNASGPRTFKYGPTRNWVRRIRVVLSNGHVLDISRGEIRAINGVIHIPDPNGVITICVPTYDFKKGIKNATGLMSGSDMDLIDLFIGSEGILGVITEADVYLAPWHPLISNILFFSDYESAYGFVKGLNASVVRPEFIEFFDGGSLNLIRRSRLSDSRFTGMPDIPDYAGSAVFFDLPYDDIIPMYDVIRDLAEIYGGSLDRSWCGHEIPDRKRFFSFRYSVPQSIFDYIGGLKTTIPGMHKRGTDMSVPLDNLDAMMDNYRTILSAANLEYVIFGHIGNGHLHVEILLKCLEDIDTARKAYRELAIKAIELDGLPSAEHGIGKIKNEYIGLMYGNEGVVEIKGIKDALDPNWILCPGNMVTK